MEDNESLKYIENEYKDLYNTGIPQLNITIGKEEDDPYTWIITMLGPKDTSYAGGLFYLKVKFPTNYPNSPSTILFITPIYHINVNHLYKEGCKLGNVFLSALKYWKKEYRMRGILPNVYALFYLSNEEN